MCRICFAIFLINEHMCYIKFFKQVLIVYVICVYVSTRVASVFLLLLEVVVVLDDDVY